jgi:hypothetical protein
MTESWVTVSEAASATGVSRSALRTWYRTDQVPSRLVQGPNGPQRELPLEAVLDRARMSQRLARQAAATTEPAARATADTATAHDGCVAAIAALEGALLRAEQRAERAEAELRALLERGHNPPG